MVYELHPFLGAGQVDIVAEVSQGAVKVINHWEQGRERVGRRTAYEFCAFAQGALAVVVEFGVESEVAIFPGLQLFVLLRELGL